MLVVECYDNKGMTADRYTVLYQSADGAWIRLLMSEDLGTARGVLMVNVFNEKPSVFGEPVEYWSLPHRVRDAILHDLLETSEIVHQASDE